MTTIIGIQGKGWGLIAAESLIVGADQKFIATGMDKVEGRQTYHVKVGKKTYEYMYAEEIANSLKISTDLS